MDACGDTLETLQLSTTEGPPYGCEELLLSSVQMMTRNFTGISPIRYLDLSRNKSLRTLEVTVRDIDDLLMYAPPVTVAGLFADVLSTIKSPIFSGVAVIYRHDDFDVVERTGHPSSGRLTWLSPAERAGASSLHHWRFEVFRTMRKVRDFQLASYADVWEGRQGLGASAGRGCSGRKCKRGIR